MSREAFIHGIYPRSENLVVATQGLDRGRVSAEQVTALQTVDRQVLVHLQALQPFYWIEDGKITWQDIFRPFTVTCQGFKKNDENDEEGEITRWFDNNTFYRRPVITGRLVPDLAMLDEFFPRVSDPSCWKVTLPSPFTFAKMSKDQTTANFDATLENVTQLMGAVIERLEDRGVSFIQLNEQYIPYHGSQQPDINRLVGSLRCLELRNRKAILALHSYFGDSAPLVKRLEDEDVVDVIGVDFLKTRVEDLPTSMYHGIIAGVIDGRNSNTETTDELFRIIDQIQEHTRSRILYVTHNTDLELLPEAVAREKVKCLGRLK